jgi:hypothetical protein
MLLQEENSPAEASVVCTVDVEELLTSRQFDKRP